MEISIVISILSITFAILSFSFSRKDKNKEESYHLGQIDTKLKNIEEVLSKIEKKLDGYDEEIDDKIQKAIDNHIKEYHK